MDLTEFFREGSIHNLENGKFALYPRNLCWFFESIGWSGGRSVIRWFRKTDVCFRHVREAMDSSWSIGFAVSRMA